MRVNAMTEKFEDVTVLGHPMLFTCLRVDRDTVPQGMYMYEVRHDDDQQGEPVQIANWIMVNHWGTLISNRPIRLRRYSQMAFFLSIASPYLAGSWSFCL